MPHPPCAGCSCAKTNGMYDCAYTNTERIPLDECKSRDQNVEHMMHQVKLRNGGNPTLRTWDFWPANLFLSLCKIQKKIQVKEFPLLTISSQSLKFPTS